jgi:tRNA(Ile)-lysidine synthase
VSAADKAAPVTAAQAKALFDPLAHATALILAVSGGPDSTALLVLAARWRAGRRRGPELVAVTIDHGLRRESAAEARAVARLARELGVHHRTLRWREAKPASGLQEAARDARYRLLGEAARAANARYVVTAHTLDDQAETVLIRMTRGSGLSGLGAMARVSLLPARFDERRPAPSPLEGEGWGGGSTTTQNVRSLPSRRASRVDLPLKGGGESPRGADALFLVRPFLDIPKSRLVATLSRAKIDFADDASNRDPRFTRPRLRGVMPVLAREGLHAGRLATLAFRLRRAEAAIEMAVGVAARALADDRPWLPTGPVVFDARQFAHLPAEVALRLLGRAIAHCGDEGPVELGKLESLFGAILAAHGKSLPVRRTLAGALVSLGNGRLSVERAPPRRTRRLTTARTGRRSASKPR